MIGSALLAALPVLTGAELREHNPSGAPVTEVHMVLSSHFDAGCKTPGCGEIVEGEPKVCAKVGAGNAHGATDPFVRPSFPSPPQAAPCPRPHGPHTDFGAGATAGDGGAVGLPHRESVLRRVHPACHRAGRGGAAQRHGLLLHDPVLGGVALPGLPERRHDVVARQRRGVGRPPQPPLPQRLLHRRLQGCAQARRHLLPRIPPRRRG